MCKNYGSISTLIRLQEHSLTCYPRQQPLSAVSSRVHLSAPALRVPLVKSAQRGFTQRAFEITFSPENKEGIRSRYRALAARHKVQELISLGIKVFLTRLMLVILGCLPKRDIKGAARIWTKVSSAASGKFQEIFHYVEVNVCNTKP